MTRAGLTKNKLAGLLILLGLAVVTGVILQPEQSSALFQQDPGGGGGSGGDCSGYLCEYCCEEFCGCSQPGGTYFFVGSCACSSISCYRQCDWAEPRAN